ICSGCTRKVDPNAFGEVVSRRRSWPRLILFVTHSLPGGKRFRILPVELVVPSGQVAGLRVLVAGRPDLLCPICKREQKLAIYKVAHVDAPDGLVVLDVVDSIEITAAIRLRHARKPALVPRRGHVLEDGVAALANVFGEVERPVNGRDGALGLASP